MYKVKLDGKYLYHPWDGKLTLADGTLTQELNKNGVFDFSIPLAHPLAGGILRRKSVVEVIRFHKNRAEETVYRGCCMNDTVNEINIFLKLKSRMNRQRIRKTENGEKHFI